MKRLRSFLLLVLFVPAGFAQSPPPDSFSGSIRTRAEAWDWFDAPANDDYAYLGTLIRAGWQKKIDRVSYRIEVAAPILLGLPDDATAPAPAGALGLGANYYQANGEQNAASVFLKQGYVDFGTSTRLRLGRFEFMEGTEPTKANPKLVATRSERLAHRLIGNFGFSHVQRSFDGVQLQHVTGPWQFTAVAARPTEGVFAVGKNGNLGIDVVYLSGGHSSTQHDGRLFVIGYADDRSVAKSDNRPAPVRNGDREPIEIRTFGGHYLREVKLGSRSGDVLLWLALQEGSWGQQDHSAGALDVEAAVRFGVTSQRVLRAGFFASTGDDSPGDGDHETFFALLPTPRLHARFPFYNAMNQNDFFVEFASPLSSKVSMRAAAHHLTLDESTDLWYAGGGAFADENFGFAGRPASRSDDLASVIDVSADYKLTPNATLSAYVAHAFGGNVIDAIYDSSSANFAFVEMTYRF